MEEEKEVMRARSFRDEDYETRRVFLRSYPLQWEEEKPEVHAAESTESVEVSNLSLKSKVIAAFQWGKGKVLLLKHKIALLIVSCQPFQLRSSSNKLLTI